MTLTAMAGSSSFILIIFVKQTLAYVS